VVTAKEMRLNECKDFVAANAELEVLDYHDLVHEYGFFKLLTHLPKLQSLVLHNLNYIHRSADFQHLLRLTGLTKLTLRSRDNLNDILIELAKCMNLVELNVWMKFNGESFAVIKTFQNLNVLSVAPIDGDWNEGWISDATVFSPRLQRLKIEFCEMSCGEFLPLLQHLRYLKEFDTGFGGIRLDDRSKLFHSRLRVVTKFILFSWFQALISRAGKRWSSGR